LELSEQWWKDNEELGVNVKNWKVKELVGGIDGSKSCVLRAQLA